MTGEAPSPRLDLGTIGLCAAAMLGTLTSMASSTMVNVALPQIMRHFSVSAVSAQFVMTGFLAAMTVAMPAAGALTLRWGARWVMLGALVVFAFASLVAAAATSLPGIIGARLVQGAAAGIIQPAALAALYLAFPPHRRGTAVGLHALAIVLAPALGPWLGGLTVEAFGWPALFAVAAPVALVAAGACAIFVPKAPPGHGAAPFDAGGMARLGLAFACLMIAVWEFARPAGNQAVALVAAAAGIVAIAIFVRHQLRAPYPLVQLRLLGAPGFRAACAVGFLLGAGLYGSTLLVPLLAQFVQFQGPAASGLLLLPGGLVLLALSPVAGWLGNRYPPAPMIAMGLSLFALSNLAFLAIDGGTPFWLTAAVLAAGRAGLAFASPLTNLAALRSLPDRDTPHAAGLISFSRHLGSLAGVIGFSVIVAPAVAGEGVGSAAVAVAPFHAAFALAGVLLVSGLIAVRELGRHGAPVAEQNPADPAFLAQSLEALPGPPVTGAPPEPSAPAPGGRARKSG